MKDLISRQSAIDAIRKDVMGGLNYESILKRLPSAEPKRKIGSWVTDDEFIDCSICRREKWSRVPYENLVKKFRYCPNCGAKMEVDNEVL